MTTNKIYIIDASEDKSLVNFFSRNIDDVFSVDAISEKSKLDPTNIIACIPEEHILNSQHSVSEISNSLVPDSNDPTSLRIRRNAMISYATHLVSSVSVVNVNGIYDIACAKIAGIETLGVVTESGSVGSDILGIFNLVFPDVTSLLSYLKSNGEHP